MELADITLPNYRVSSLIDNLDQLIDCCITDDATLNHKYKSCGYYYRKFCEIMIQKQDYSEDDIKDFQKNVDSFMEIWCSIGGKRMMTNYFHMLGSGHIKYYMKEWGNLYRYEQEGWESLNALIKSRFFLHTQRGGFVAKGESAGSDPIVSNRAGSLGKWFVRNLLWKSGKANEYMCKRQHN